MNIIQSVEISSDENNNLVMSVGCTDSQTQKDTSQLVAQALTNDALISFNAKTWLPIKSHIDLYLDLQESPRKLQLREKDVPEGPRGKGMVFSVVPALFLRLGLISEEESNAFNEAIQNHPLVVERLKKIHAGMNAHNIEVKDALNAAASAKKF